MQKQRGIRTSPLALLFFCAAWQPFVAADADVDGRPGAKSPSPEVLIEQLGDESFFAREKATAALIAAGPAVEPRVRALLDHADAEIRYRSEIVLIEIDKNQRASRRASFLEGDIGKLKSNIKSWERFSELVGNTRESRELFLAMLNGGEELLTAGEKSASECSAMITQLYTAQSNARRFGEEAVSPGGVMAMLFVAGDKEINLDATATSRVTSLLSQYRGRLDGKYPAFQTLMGHMIRESRGTQQYQMLRLADQFGLKNEGLALARKMVGEGHSTYRAQAMILIGKLGDKKDAASLADYISDNSPLGTHVVRNGKNRVTKLGDVALAMSIVLAGEKPGDFGFPDAPDGRPTSTSYYNYGFYDEAKRAEARKKWQARPNSQKPGGKKDR